MITNKVLGRGQLVNRLATQVGSRELAIRILQKRGDLKPDGKTLTRNGRSRDAMTAESRAKDRLSRSTGKATGDYRYNALTNRASRSDKTK